MTINFIVHVIHVTVMCHRVNTCTAKRIIFAYKK